jgi:hypothetical protein
MSARGRSFGLVLVLSAGLAASAGSALAQDGVRMPASGVLELRAGSIDLVQRPDLRDTLARFDADTAYVVSLDGPMTPARRAALEGEGVLLREYLPTHAYIAWLGGATVEGLRKLDFVRGVYGVETQWKLAADLGTRAYQTAERQDLAARGLAAASITLYEGREPARALAALRGMPGVSVLDFADEGGSWTITATMPPASAAGVAALPDVMFVDDAPEFTLRNNTVRWIVQTNVSNSTPFYTAGLTGTGQIVGIIDGGLDPNHCSFAHPDTPIGPSHRKILAHNGGFWADSHGTHVSGTAVGDNGVNDDTRGIAYGAKMVFNSIPSMTETQMFNRFNLHRGQGAAVHTNSWGNDSTTAYDGACRSIDNFSWQYDDNLVLFAVTNGSLLKNPENAKNVLAVAASGDSGSQGSMCSGGAGPTSDGRRKPEVTAPGCSTRSSQASSACGVVSLTGTSMASPAVAGAAALVREYFTDGYYPSGAAVAADAFVPSGALIKACLINSAVDMTGVTGYPAAREGWGRVLLDNALFLAGDTRRLVVHDVRNASSEALSTGGSWMQRFRINSGSMPVEATLVWHDAPAAVNAASAAINNLNLSVATSAADVFLGNNFNNGASRSGGSPDAINNTEQVLLTSPSPGIAVLRVSAAAVNVGTQGFAVCLTGDVTPLCPADVDGDGFIDFFDFDAFVQAFESGDTFTADFDGDGFVDFIDFDAFVTAYETGC